MGELHVDGSVRFGLGDLEQALANQLEHRQEIHDEHGHAAHWIEELAELGKTAGAQPSQDEGHVLPHR
jgi:hypothetical protein